MPPVFRCFSFLCDNRDRRKQEGGRFMIETEREKKRKRERELGRDEYGYDIYDCNHDGYVTLEDGSTLFREEGNDSIERVGRWADDSEKKERKPRERDERER